MAESHNKPVSLDETSAVDVFITPDPVDGLNDWNQWFVNWFAFFTAHPNVKSFNYTNSNWPTHGDAGPPGWGDANIKHNSVIAGKYAAEMHDPKFLHLTQKDQLANCGTAGGAPPLVNVTLQPDAFGVSVAIKPAPGSPPPAKCYITVTKGGLPTWWTDYEVTGPDFYIGGLEPATNYSVTVVPVDAAGNPSTANETPATTLPADPGVKYAVFTPGSALTLASGGTSIEAPADWLDTPATLRLKALSADSLTAPADLLAGTAVDLGPSGAFKNPVKISLPITKQNSGLPSRICQQVNNKWVPIETTVIGEVAYAELDHFSVYAPVSFASLADNLKDIYVAPTPALAGGAAPFISLLLNGTADRFEGRVYNQAGELVQFLSNVAQPGNGLYSYKIPWNVGGLASGVYLIYVNAFHGETIFAKGFAKGVVLK